MHDKNGVGLSVLEQCRILKLPRATYYERRRFEAERQKKKAGGIRRPMRATSATTKMAARSVSCVLSQNTTGCSREMGAGLEQKEKVKELLASEEYKTLMKKRSTECETVFNQTKGNPGFRNFHLRRKAKAGTEWGLLMIGYDFKQLVRLMNA